MTSSYTPTWVELDAPWYVFFLVTIIFWLDNIQYCVYMKQAQPTKTASRFYQRCTFMQFLVGVRKAGVLGISSSISLIIGHERSCFLGAVSQMGSMQGASIDDNLSCFACCFFFVFSLFSISYLGVKAHNAGAKSFPKLRLCRVDLSKPHVQRGSWMHPVSPDAAARR